MVDTGVGGIVYASTLSSGEHQLLEFGGSLGEGSNGTGAGLFGELVVRRVALRWHECWGAGRRSIG